MSPRRIAAFRDAVLRWHSSHSRDFPWRRPGIAPFKLFVAEMLLRKTAATRVAPVVLNVWARYPDAAALAGAGQRELAAELRPLGLHRVRARALRQCAATIHRLYGGVPPRQHEELTELPHAGRYVASATRCFAYGEQEPVVDANIARIFERFFGISTERQLHLADEVWEFAGVLMGTAPARAWNFAMLDFAALVCVPRTPRCVECPVARACRYRPLPRRPEVR